MTGCSCHTYSARQQMHLVELSLLNSIQSLPLADDPSVVRLSTLELLNSFDSYYLNKRVVKIEMIMMMFCLNESI